MIVILCRSIVSQAILKTSSILTSLVVLLRFRSHYFYLKTTETLPIGGFLDDSEEGDCLDPT